MMAKRGAAKIAATVVALMVALFAVLALLGTGDIIDLPAWANIKGIDVPLIGNLDAVDCKLQQVEGTSDVAITIVDGDKSAHADYVHVWNNGNLVEPELVRRISDSELISPSTAGAVEQYYGVSIEPVREKRVYCEFIVLAANP